MPNPDPNLLLIGLRGSGKSTLGRALASCQNRPFLDLDDATAAFLHCDSVAEAWSRHGEPAFRDAESRALSAVLHDSGRIIALGGGTPTAPGASELIERAKHERRCVVAYLRCTPDELRARLQSLGPSALADRPSLTGAHPLDEIESVFAARDPLYRTIATRTIDDLADINKAVAALDGWHTWRSS